MTTWAQERASKLTDLQPTLRPNADKILAKVTPLAERFRQYLGDAKWNLVFGNHDGTTGHLYEYASSGPEEDGALQLYETFPKVEAGQTEGIGYRRSVRISPDGSMWIRVTDHRPLGPGNLGVTVECDIEIDSNGTELTSSTRIEPPVYEVDSPPNPLIPKDDAFFGEVLAHGPYIMLPVVDCGEHIHPQVAVDGKVADRFLSFTGVNQEKHVVCSIVRANEGELNVTQTPF